MSQLYQKVIDPTTGADKFIAIPPETNAAIDLSVKVITIIIAYIRARIPETSTHLGAAITPFAGPAIGEAVNGAVLSIGSGDYVGAALNSTGAVLGLFGIFAAICTPEPVKTVVHVVDPNAIQAVANGSAQ